MPIEDEFTLRNSAFEFALENMGLAGHQITAQTRDELETSLIRINAAIEAAQSFDATEHQGLQSVDKEQEHKLKNIAFSYLLDRKKLILDRITATRPHQELTSVRNEVSSSVGDVNTKEQVLAIIDERLAAERDESERLRREAVDLAERRAADSRLKLELSERRTQIYKSMLARETVASGVGAILLFALGTALIVAMFNHTEISSIVSDSFLVILGYFFGTAASQKSDK